MEEKNEMRIKYLAFLTVCYNLELEVIVLRRLCDELVDINNWKKNQGESELEDVERAVNVLM